MNLPITFAKCAVAVLSPCQDLCKETVMGNCKNMNIFVFIQSASTDHRNVKRLKLSVHHCR